jgi:hypothetical protein
MRTNPVVKQSTYNQADDTGDGASTTGKPLDCALKRKTMVPVLTY